MECLSSRHEVRVPPPALHALGKVAHACGLRTQEIEAGPSEVRGYSSLHSESEARLSYNGCYLK